MRINIRNKKMGFTIIELIVAIAIMALAFPVISSVFMNALNYTKDESIKLDTMTDAQSIAQGLKFQGKYGVGEIYNNLATDTEKHNLSSVILNITYDNVGQVCGTDGLLNLPEYTDRSASMPIGSISSSRMNNLGSHYETEITITPEEYSSNSSNNNNFIYFNMYDIKVKVKDLVNNTVESENTVLIGG